MTSVNDVSKCNPESSNNARKRDNKITVYDDTSEIHNEGHRSMRNVELCTILEKTGSDAERSGETIFDEDSSNGSDKKKIKSKLPSESSPILTIVDSESIHFMKSTQRSSNDNVLNVYGNQAFEEHWTDALIGTDGKGPRIKHSYSLDLTRAPKDKKRKLSVETKFETVMQTKGLDNIIEL